MFASLPVPKPPLVLLLISSFCFSFSLAAPADCSASSRKCGGVNITYPFWIADSYHPSFYCGYTKFKVECIESTPTLQIGNDSYNITKINASSRIVSLVDGDIQSSDSCPRVKKNLTIDELPVNYTQTDANLTFLFDCTGDLSMANRISCLSDGSYVFRSDLIPPGALRVCTSVVISPVLSSSFFIPDALPANFARLLHEGFELIWYNPESPDCLDCEKSKGLCGYSNSSGSWQLQCICPDPPGPCRGVADRIAKSSSHTDDKGKGRNKRSAIIGGVAGAAALLLIAGGILFMFRLKRQRRLGPAKLLSEATSSGMQRSVDPESGVLFQTHVFSYEELRDATDDFHQSRELGDGGFGAVYKGKLRDGRVVAVKRLYENNFRRAEQYLNEVEILSRLRHPNLVTLYGCTALRSQELLLVYEFVPNGTVADHLHGSRASERVLTWPRRMSIAIESATALAYLHAVEPPIIHRDVKTTNILLDSDFHVKVADFGLSRLFPLDVTHVSTAPQGTPGYVDPEYHRCFQLTDKSDVYSFGVVLIELISSKPAVDLARRKDEINLANMAISLIQRCELDLLVDPDLGFTSDAKVGKMITMVAELAFRCLQPDGDMRPPIKEVCDILLEIAGKRKPERETDVDGDGDDSGRLLKSAKAGLMSPDTVTTHWTSSTTTPNTSA